MPWGGPVSINIYGLRSQRCRHGDLSPIPNTKYADWSYGGLEPELYPSEELKQYATRALDVASGEALSYFGSGAPHEMVYCDRGLRERIANLITTRGEPTRTAAGILLVSGAAQALALVIRAFVDPREGVLMECVSKPHAGKYFAAAGAIVSKVPVDDHGMNVDAVESALMEMAQRGVRPKLIYTIPTFHVPTGVVMLPERRERLLALARKWDVLVVEDNVQYELYYGQPPLLPLRSLDTDGRVIQLESFSKTLAPALRIGWVSAVPAVIETLARVREDTGVSLWLARTVDQYIADGKLGAHLERVRAASKRRRDYALNVLRQYCGNWTTCSAPPGGAYLWLELSARVDWQRVRTRLAREGLMCDPTETLNEERDGKQFLRFGFLQACDAELDRWCNALGRAIAVSVKH